MNFEFQIADLYDEYSEKLKVLEPIFKSYGAKELFHGEVVTVKCYEDNSLVAELVKTSGKGKVLVIDGGGSLRKALLGDNLAKNALDNGWAGIVIYGCLRDSAIINTFNIGIRALNTNPAKTLKMNQGQQGITLSIAGVEIKQGDYLYADQDGIAISDLPLI